MNKSKLIKSVAAVTICAATIAAITACASAAKPVGPAQNEPDISAIAREDDQYIGGALEDINVDDLEDIDFYDSEDSDDCDDCEGCEDCWEDLAHMFDRFYTGKKGSTGIGLALAKEIVELHGWSISADNRDDGLQVTIKY